MAATESLCAAHLCAASPPSVHSCCNPAIQLAWLGLGLGLGLGLEFGPRVRVRVQARARIKGLG